MYEALIYYGIPNIDELYGYYGVEVTKANQDLYHILECETADDVAITTESNPRPYKIYKSIKCNYWFEHTSEGSVEESFEYCHNKMAADAFYLGANAVLGYDTVMNFWDGVVTYRISGNLMVLAERKVE